MTDSYNQTSINLGSADSIVFNVKNFGAAGDGVANDSSAIQRAIDAAATVGGGIVYMPFGQYFVSTNTVQIKAGVSLEGAGINTEIIVNPVSTGAAENVLEVIGQYSAVKNLRITGSQTGETGPQRGIRVQSASDVDIFGVSFYGNDSTTGFNVQISIDQSSRVRVENCLFERIVGINSSYGYGILLGQSNDCIITNNVGIQSATQGRHHVYISVDSSDNVVSNNNFSLGTSAAIGLNATSAQSPCQYNLIIGNELVQCNSTNAVAGAIIIAVNCHFNTIQGNMISDSINHGIWFESHPTDGAGARVEDNYVIGNTIVNSQGAGIYLRGGQRIVIQGNSVIDSSQSGAGNFSGIFISSNTVTSPGDNNRCLSNYVQGTLERSAIRISAGAPAPIRTVLIGNSVVVGTVAGIEDGGAATVLIANDEEP